MKTVNCDKMKSFWIILSLLILLISVLFGALIISKMNKCDEVDEYLVDWLNQKFHCHDFNHNNWCIELSGKCKWSGEIRENDCDCIAIEKMGIYEFTTNLNTTAAVQVFVTGKCDNSNILNHDEQCKKITCDMEHGCPIDCILWGSFRNKYCFTGLEETEKFTDEHNLTSGGKCGSKLSYPVPHYSPMYW